MLRWCPDHVNARESSSHHRRLQASVAGTKRRRSRVSVIFHPPGEG